jgi:two-component system, chemotaxis family, chemotaxis protein CheY
MSKTILAVDDSPSMRQMVAFTLKRAGYDVVEAADGCEGIARAKSTPVNLIITDLNMPNMNGIEMIKQLRGETATKFTPIIMLTTESQPERKLEGKTAGATGWIVKPFTPEQLVAVVQKVIR